MTPTDARTEIVKLVNSFDNDDVAAILLECQVIQATNGIRRTHETLTQQRHEFAEILKGHNEG